MVLTLLSRGVGQLSFLLFILPFPFFTYSQTQRRHTLTITSDQEARKLARSVSYLDSHFSYCITYHGEFSYEAKT